MIVYFKRLIDIYTPEGARSAFEMLCNDLLILEDPKTKPMRANPGDKGIDAYTRLADDRYHVYQTKYFTEQLGDKQKEQIRDSFATAQAYLGDDLVAWTLLIAKDLDADEAKWFDTFKKKRAPVDIDWWGETKLRGALSRHTHVEEKYFKTGTEAILRAIVKQQGELLSTLQTALVDNVSRPALRLRFLRPDGLHDVLEVPESEFKPAPSSVSLLDDSQVASLVERWKSTIPVKQVRKVCSTYNKQASRYLDTHTDAELARYSLEYSTYVIVAVQNDGTCPAESVKVQLDFPDTLVAAKDLDDWRKLLEEHEQPVSPESVLERIRSSNAAAIERGSERPRGMRLLAQALPGAYEKFNAMPSLTRLSAMAGGMARRTAIELDASTATYWLKSVKHAGESDKHIGERQGCCRLTCDHAAAA